MYDIELLARTNASRPLMGYLSVLGSHSSHRALSPWRKGKSGAEARCSGLVDQIGCRSSPAAGLFGSKRREYLWVRDVNGRGVRLSVLGPFI